MNERANNPFLWLTCGANTARDLRNQKRFLWITLAWAVAFVTVSYVIKHGMVGPGPVGWLLALLPSVAILFVFQAFVRFVTEADELQRQIQLRGLALGFGAGWLAICGYPLLEELGAPATDAGTYVAVMAVAYSAGCVHGAWKYR